MKKRSRLTQELANSFGDWTNIRKNTQSLGQRILNSHAHALEGIEKETRRTGDNLHLTTANLEEMAWIYRVEIPNTYTFTENDNDSYVTNYDEPTVSGYQDGSYYLITQADDNNVDTFWYNRVPDRITFDDVTSGVHLLLDDYSHNAPHSGFNTPYNYGHLYVTMDGGEKYVRVDEDNLLRRAFVTIKGTTRKGTEEEEVMAFPWDQTQKTLKEWKTIDEINCIDVESGVSLTVKSEDYNNAPYLDFYNLETSPDRKKIDEFWDYTNDGSYHYLDKVRHTTDEVYNLLAGAWEYYEHYRHELLDTTGSGINDIVDIAQQPYTDYVWVLTNDKLYCYDNYTPAVQDPSKFDDVTESSKIEVVFDRENYVRGEDALQVKFLSRSALLKVNKYQAWVEYPDGTKNTILNGALTTYSVDDYTFLDQTVKRIDVPLEFTSTQTGEHIFTLKAEMSDNVTYTTKRALYVSAKNALAEFTVTPTLSPAGLTFNSDQELYMYTDDPTYSGYCKVNLHHDTMIVDYDNKELFLRENYDHILIW